jgi:Transposase domain (DUF772)
LLRELLLQAFYTIRSETQLMEQLDYSLLYRWFVGLGVDDAVWVPTVFTKNRDRLLKADAARKFLAELMEHKELRGSNEHFSVGLVLVVPIVDYVDQGPRPSPERRHGALERAESSPLTLSIAT